ncbi:MAG: hypothetical protein AB7O57_03350 [Hyphomicrobiaceae bacterium]
MTATSNIRTLETAEIDAVSGGIGFLIPLIVVAIVIGTTKCSTSPTE